MNAIRRAQISAAEEKHLAWPADPEGLAADSVDFEALAHVLANTCRRDGRMRGYHSLAAHGVAMSEAIEDLPATADVDVRESALHALLYEAAVAWMGPEAAPSRRQADRPGRLAAKVDRMVREAAGLEGEPSPEQAELLRFIARMADAAEARDLTGSEGKAALLFPPLERRIRALPPARAAKLWLERLNDLRRPPGAAGSEEAIHSHEAGEGNHPAKQEKLHATQAKTATGETGTPQAGGSRDAA